MTNKQYQRKVRALDRTKSRKASFGLDMELATLHRLTSEYRQGMHRAMNGSGKTRHPSNAAA